MIPRNSPLIFTREVICVRWGDCQETPWQSTCMKPVQKIKLQFANSCVEGLAVLWMKSACCRGVSHRNSSGLALLALFCQWGNWDFEQGNNLPKVLCSLSCRENFKPMTLLSILSISRIPGHLLNFKNSVCIGQILWKTFVYFNEGFCCVFPGTFWRIHHSDWHGHDSHWIFQSGKVIDFQENVYILFILVFEG